MGIQAHGTIMQFVLATLAKSDDDSSSSIQLVAAASLSLCIGLISHVREEDLGISDNLIYRAGRRARLTRTWQGLSCSRY